MKVPDHMTRQIIVTLPDESQLLVTDWAYAPTEIDWRRSIADIWQPLDVDRITVERP